MQHKNLIQLLNVDLFYCSLLLDSIRVALHHFRFKISLEILVMFNMNTQPLEKYLLPFNLQQ